MKRRFFYLLSLVVGSVIGLALESAMNDASSTESYEMPPRRALPGGEGARSPQPSFDSSLSSTEIDSELRAIGGLPSNLSPAALETLVRLQESILACDLAVLAKDLCMGPDVSAPEVYQLVMGLYAAKEPTAAWALVNEVRNHHARTVARLSVIVSIAELDPPHAFVLLDQVKDAEERRELRREVLRAVARQAPETAWKYCQLKASEEPRGNLDAILFQAWAERDPVAAKSAAARLSGRDAAPAYAGVVNALVLDDPRSAWTYAVNIPPDASSVMTDPVATAARSWARVDPRSAVQAAMTLRTTSAQRAILSAMEEWAASDLDTALQFTVQVQNANLRSDILVNLSSSDSCNPRTLLPAVLRYVPDSHQLGLAITRMFTTWSARTPGEAAVALEQLPQGPAYQQAVALVAARWTTAAPEKGVVLDWLETLPNEEARRIAQREVFTTWAARDSQAALASLQRLQGVEKEEASVAVAKVWVTTDPEAAIHWAVGFENVKQRNEAVCYGFAHWAKVSPQMAAGHWQTMSPELQGVTLGSLIEAWSGVDTLAAANWLRGHPAGAAKDEAIKSVAKRLVREDPPGAIRWASTISDKTQRNIQMELLAYQWLKWDPANARAWMANSDFPPEIRAKFKN